MRYAHGAGGSSCARQGITLCQLQRQLHWFPESLVHTKHSAPPAPSLRQSAAARAQTAAPHAHHDAAVLARIEAVHQRLPPHHLQLLLCPRPQRRQGRAVAQRRRVVEPLPRPPPHVPARRRARPSRLRLGGGGTSANGQLRLCAERALRGGTVSRSNSLPDVVVGELGACGGGRGGLLAGCNAGVESTRLAARLLGGRGEPPDSPETSPSSFHYSCGAGCACGPRPILARGAQAREQQAFAGPPSAPQDSHTRAPALQHPAAALAPPHPLTDHPCLPARGSQGAPPTRSNPPSRRKAR